MRALGFIAVLTLMPACQMGLPSGQNSAKNSVSVVADAPSAADVASIEAVPDAAEILSAEANLAAAFEQAALAAEVDPAPKKKRLFGFLKPDLVPDVAVLAGTDIEVIDGAQAALEQDIEPQLDDVEAASNPEPQTPSDAGADVDAGDLRDKAQPQDTDPFLESATPVRSGLGGLFGLLKPKHGNAQTQVALKAPAPEATPDAEADTSAEPALTDLEIEEPSALPSTPEPNEAEAKKPRFGLFKPRSGAPKSRKTPLSTVALGEVLPFGVVGISCEARKGDMGKRVDQFPGSGPATWQIYDTDPSSIAPRTQFITGFKDGCARQVTAALILFGSPSLHEVHRYSKSRSKVSWSKADNSYESVKSKVCGVGRKTPCPSGKVGQLEKHMAFVSVYKQFGDAKGWLELLLHDGKMETQELR